MDLAKGLGGNDATQVAAQFTNAQFEKNNGPGTESRGAERDKNNSTRNNKTCHRNRIAHLTGPCPSHKNL